MGCSPPLFFQNKCSCFVKESGEERGERCGRGITSAVVMVMLGADAGVLHVNILCSIVRDFLILIICVFMWELCVLLLHTCAKPDRVTVAREQSCHTPCVYFHKIQNHSWDLYQGPRNVSCKFRWMYPVTQMSVSITDSTVQSYNTKAIRILTAPWLISAH